MSNPAHDGTQPFTTADGTEFPAQMILIMADGTKHTFHTKGPKPSKATGRQNAFYGGKLLGDDGSRFQVGCNVTQLD